MTTATISQIATALGLSRQAVLKRGTGWQSTGERVQGGGDTYDIDTISLRKGEPQKIKKFIAKTACKIIPIHPQDAQLPAVIETAPLPAMTSLTKHQVAVMDARVWFMRIIETRPVKCSVKQAMADIVTLIATDQTYMNMAAAANARRGKERTLAPRTIMHWWQAWRDSERNPAALAPNDADARRVAREEILIGWLKEYRPNSRLPMPAGIPAWLPILLDEYRQPQKPDLAATHRDLRRMLPAGISYPTYDQVYDLFQKIPITLREKGRLTGAEYKSLLGYATRDASMDDPFTIMQIDGHSLKAYVAHPTTGAHFHPEVCAIICLTTKVLGGWSAGLAESNETVADAFRHCCTITETKPFGSVPAIVEPDRGPGNLAGVNADELTGRFARLGTTFLPPERGGNPQGHGAIERSNQSIWVRAAKSLVTYTGKDMDRVMRKRVYIKLEKDLKAVEKAGQLGRVEKTSELLMSWREFLSWLDQWAMEYNNTPHSALAKITDQQTGRRRHMTPLECLAARIAQGWEPVTYDGDMMPYLFMPHEKITVKRCQFTLHGNNYHSYELHHRHGQDMIAAYDIHDPKTVWVLTMDEIPVCMAAWNGNKIHAQPTSVKDQAIHQRHQRRLKNNDNKRRMIEGEARTTATIEITPEMRQLKEKLIASDAETAPQIAKVITLQLPEPEPVEEFNVPIDERDKYKLWCMLEGLINGGLDLTEDQQRFYEGFKRSAIWKAYKKLGK